jgi:hypothetical protein
VGDVKETVGTGADTAKMVEGGRKEKHILVNKRLDDGRVSRGRATPERLPLGKVMRASSGNRCKRCITLIRGRRRDGHIDNSIVGRGRSRSRVALVMRVKLEANVGRAGVGGGGNEILWFVGDETESREVTKPAPRGPSSRQTVPKASRMALLGAALWYLYRQEKRWTP